MRCLLWAGVVVAAVTLTACLDSEKKTSEVALSRAEKSSDYEGPRELRRREFHPRRGEADTVGGLRAVIEPDSRAFRSLVICEHESIVFKNEEGDGSDQRMTEGTRRRLVRLAELVAAEWPGLQLRVTEAWDGQGEHGRRSLHYEGRAVDLTLSDLDRTKLGRLGGLAAQAGFEWVYYEISHIHASTARD